MARILLNRTTARWTQRSIEQPDQTEVKNTPGLFNASLEDALVYGGDLTRAALSAMKLRGDRKYILVDVKVHMLMPGMYPAIPGWHTDGVPRVDGKPDIFKQNRQRSPLFHLLVTGEGCLTDFASGPIELEVPDQPDSKLYEMVSEQMFAYTDSGDVMVERIPSCEVVEWDWWALHTAVPATKREWRYLIRVTETDYRPPKTDLRDVLKRQEQVYVPEAFGW